MGHYAIQSLIQKVKAVSARVFESDYLCLRPKVSGTWFTTFDETKHLARNGEADYDPRFGVHVTVDSGVHTGAIWFQVRPPRTGSFASHNVTIFGDYFAEGLSAEANARKIKEQTRVLCGDRPWNLRVSHDAAGDSRTPMGVTVRGEYERSGLQGTRGLESWPRTAKADSLAMIEALLESADGTIGLRIHPRCKHLVKALQCYKRASVANQYMDYPDDPQHPFEDLIDPLAGGLKLEFPEGRRPPFKLKPRHAARLH